MNCGLQCFDVLTKFGSLRKLMIFYCNFRISCQSLEKFVKLCRIIVYSDDFDFQDLVKTVSQLCTQRPQQMFYLQLRTTSEEINELSQNIPKILCIQNTISKICSLKDLS